MYIGQNQNRRDGFLVVGTKRRKGFGKLGQQYLLTFPEATINERKKKKKYDGEKLKWVLYLVLTKGTSVTLLESFAWSIRARFPFIVGRN